MTRSLIGLALVFALFLAACSGAETTTTTAATTTAATTTGAPTGEAEFPTTVRSDAGLVTIETRPERVVVLSPSHVEMMFAMGAGDQVIAGDLFSNYPVETERLQKLDSFNLSAESVIALDPDLIVLSFDPGEAVAAFHQVGIPTLLFNTPTDLGGVLEQTVALGVATGNRTRATHLANAIGTAVNEIVLTTGELAADLTFYHEVDPFSFFTPNSSSFIGQLYALLGMVNIADAAPDEFGQGFPQLSPEFILDADPQLIFMAAEGETVDSLISRDGWNTLSAASAPNSIFVLDSDAAGRWGPRIVDVLRHIANAVRSHTDGAG